MISSKFAGLVSPAGDPVETSEPVRRTVYNKEQLPLVFEAAPETDINAWIREHREELREDLHRHGALLFRSPVRPDFDGLVNAFGGRAVEYQGGAAIRSRVSKDTYTASEYPEELDIRLHSEFCYSNDWPMLLFFQCDIAPSDRGQTPLANNRAILRDIPDDIRRQFAERGLLYTRGYGYNRTWQRSYETADREAVEKLCADEGRRVEWIDGDQLRTYENRPAIASHPYTGEDVWFNYAHGFHISRMDSGIREALSTSPDDSDEQLWPNNVFWGDGSEIDAETISVVNDVVERHSVQFDWEVGDTLVVDNMLSAHGRRPFSGPRRILLKTAESYLSLRKN
ncbi:TauD/TfdA family dioxygenase [Streptomyces sp. NBC_00503]|uniref:TauD/TfdA family dioxygenase n=1 Tax=Streptomyces sp. NBC_00503 TaxID=2903659 RepID=UPI002E80F1C5|nr:TauD/TfdA family dioxygenase [Streptomyces sp. NBC_00503]WUD84112.1 TauD/TfdA family dioxygenase [Streptomyces sp. NBC_00503]